MLADVGISDPEERESAQVGTYIYICKKKSICVMEIYSRTQGMAMTVPSNILCRRSNRFYFYKNTKLIKNVASENL